MRVKFRVYEYLLLQTGLFCAASILPHPHPAAQSSVILRSRWPVSGPREPCPAIIAACAAHRPTSSRRRRGRAVARSPVSRKPSSTWPSSTWVARNRPTTPAAGWAVRATGGPSKPSTSWSTTSASTPANGRSSVRFPVVEKCSRAPRTSRSTNERTPVSGKLIS